MTRDKPFMFIRTDKNGIETVVTIIHEDAVCCFKLAVGGSADMFQLIPMEE